MNELNKFFTSETIEILRSEIRFADYNPRKLSNEARRQLKSNIKRNGIIGGLVWNKRTKILVSGHQRISILDELNKYDNTPETDYIVKVEQIDVDEKTEKELNVWFNNTNVQGEFNMELLAELIPQIEYKNAGFSEIDLNIIGIDYVFQTEEESNIITGFDDLMYETIRKNESEKQTKKAAVKAMKEEIMRNADEKAKNLEAYVMLSFDTFKAKASFMQRFGFDKREKYIKGEVFSEMIEVID